VFNELVRLQESSSLFTLLTHYADLALPDRQVWQPRREQLDDTEPREIGRLYGELIAYGWIELNIEEVWNAYRITTAGLRALKAVIAGEMD
jgi:hypothetical protein